MPKKKILVIDDEKTILEAAKSIFQNDEYEVLTAETGEAGINIAVSEKPDLLIVDVLLPGINGIQVCKKIRGNKELSGSRIVMMTGKIDAIDAVKARQAGADDFVVKTHDLSLLQKAVDNLMKNKGE